MGWQAWKSSYLGTTRNGLEFLQFFLRFCWFLKIFNLFATFRKFSMIFRILRNIEKYGENPQVLPKIGKYSDKKIIKKIWKNSWLDWGPHQLPHYLNRVKKRSFFTKNCFCQRFTKLSSKFLTFFFAAKIYNSLGFFSVSILLQRNYYFCASRNYFRKHSSFLILNFGDPKFSNF